MEPHALAYFGAALGASVIVLGASLGIGRLAAAAMEGISRQPEASARLQSAMIITAALVEGVALFGLVICIILATK